MNRPGKRSFSSLKIALIFPGSRVKTTKDALVRVYKSSFILSCTTSSDYQVGLLFGENYHQLHTLLFVHLITIPVLP